MPNLKLRDGTLLVAAALLLLTGCDHSIFDPFYRSSIIVHGERPIAEPEGARAMWPELAGCMGSSARFDEVEWFVADSLIGRHDGLQYAGAYRVRGARIYIAQHRLGEDWVVRHELLHHADPSVPCHTAEFRACESPD